MRIAAVAALLAACSAPVSRCKDQTLFVSVSLDTASAAADQLHIEISVDAGTPVPTTLKHTPGKSMGGVEVQFPNHYPTGHLLSVSITALLGGVIIGNGSNQVTLADHCDALALAVSSTAAPPDLNGLDLTGVDLASIQDLTASSTSDAGDLAMAGDAALLDHSDLSSADLRPLCVTEDCFNNTDDDCDGLVDCADPDCVGGGSPKAACVPNPLSFVPGMTVSGPTGVCPSAWPTTTPINANIQLSCNNGCSGCNSPNNTCDIYIFNNASDSSCGTANGWVVEDSCFIGEDVEISGYHSLSAPVWTGDCGSAGGSATNVTPTWATNDHFCSGGRMGGGCSAGSICVPAAPNHCVLKSGLTGSTPCPGNYTQRATQYYSGFDDSKRSCFCTCTSTGPGTCSGTSAVTLYDTVGCTGGSVTVGAACSNDPISGYHYPLQASALTATGPTGCAPFAGQTGDPKTGPETVCCTP